MAKNVSCPRLFFLPFLSLGAVLKSLHMLLVQLRIMFQICTIDYQVHSYLHNKHYLKSMLKATVGILSSKILTQYTICHSLVVSIYFALID